MLVGGVGGQVGGRVCFWKSAADSAKETCKETHAGTLRRVWALVRVGCGSWAWAWAMGGNNCLVRKLNNWEDLGGSVLKMITKVGPRKRLDISRDISAIWGTFEDGN